MPNELPRCVENTRGKCPRSDVILASEGDEHWAFVCRTCKGLRVITKPQGRERVQRETAMQRQAEQQRLKPKRVHFI